ncbi:MAG: hypothetical protein ISQ14_08790 [Verrucomicrobiae bacterium]|nr:hypothetical protein [Verrucomicrobiae bacterium]
MNCPSCNRLLYSRQHKTCGFCGSELPPEVLLSDDEVAAIKTEQAAIAIRRAKAKAKEEEEKRKQAASDGGFDILPMF